MKKILAVLALLALAVVAAAGIWLSVSGDSAGDRGKSSIPSEVSAVNNAEIIWGPIVRYSTRPLPSKRLVVSQNILILDRDLPSPFVAETKNARVRCDIYYTRGWTKVVRKETVPGTWTPPHIAEKQYGGQLTGQIRCGPFTVWKGAMGLWLGVNPRVTYEGVTFDQAKGRGPKAELIRRQVRRGAASKSVVPGLNEATSFLPRVAGGTLYPSLGPVPFGSPISSLWDAFGRPPDKTCSGTECYWASPDERLFVQLATPFDSAEEQVRPFDRVVVSSKHPSRTKLGDWKTPEGIHIGSTSRDVRAAYPHADCVGQRCNIVAPLASANGVRSRFQLAIVFDEDSSDPKAVVETIDVSQVSAEGTCRPTISFREQGIPDSDTTFLFTARCAGKLKSARLESLDGATQLGEAEANERLRIDPGLYRDSGGPPVSGLAFRAVATVGMAGGAWVWQVGCESPDPADPAQCAPGRGPAAPTWDAGLYEDWDLIFRGTSSVASGPQGRREVIAPLRFTAEFADRPPFTYILREAF